MSFWEAVSWPVASVVIAVVWRHAVRPFCFDLREFLRTRPWKFGAGPVTLEAGASVAQSALPAPTPPINASDASPAAPLPALNIPFIDDLEADLIRQTEEIEEAGRVPVLVRTLSITRAVYFHEYVYNRIFGTQIAALRALRDKGGACSEGDAVDFFRMAANSFPEFYATFTFDRWLNFLLANQLIRSVDSKLVLTPRGQDFLRHIDLSAMQPRPY
jgi:hypothetical protein